MRAKRSARIDGPGFALSIGMNPQIEESLADTHPSAIAPPLVAPDPAPAKIAPAVIEGEARGAWFHAQKAIGMVASELERVMTKLFNSLDNRQKPPTTGH